jgi:hypothetical protein
VKQANDSFDLPRLTETDPTLAEELTLLKAQLPDASELALMASRLQLQGIDVASPAPPPSAAASPWSKWLLVGGGALVAGLGLWALGPAKPLAARDRGGPHSTVTMAVGSAATPPPAAANPRAPRRETTISRPGQIDSTLPLVPELTPLSEVTPPRDASAVAPAKPAAVRTSEPSRAAAPATASLPPTSSARAIGSSSGLGVQSAATPTEIALLREARLALKRSPATALELTDQHTRTYPGGKLVQERELIAVSALMALGRRTAALGRAAHFEQAFPQSPYRKQLAELLR